MARNLPVAFAAIIAGGVLLDAAIKGAAISDVIKGQAVAATGSSSNAPSAAPAFGHVNPFGRATGFKSTGHVDQGIDVNMDPGSPIDAPFAGTVTAINQDWYRGQPQVVLTGKAGTPGAGHIIYFAEQLVPKVTVGQAVNAGDQLASYASSGTGVEVGWAANSQGQTLAHATTGYIDGQATAAGKAITSWLRSLGAPV